MANCSLKVEIKFIVNQIGLDAMLIRVGPRRGIFPGGDRPNKIEMPNNFFHFLLIYV